MSHLIAWLTNFAATIWGWITSGFEWVWHELLGALTTVLSAIPVPAFLTAIPSYVSAIPPGAVFFLSAFKVPQGVAIIVTAYVLRFVIRRIPIIG